MQVRQLALQLRVVVTRARDVACASCANAGFLRVGECELANQSQDLDANLERIAHGVHNDRVLAHCQVVVVAPHSHLREMFKQTRL